MFGSIEQAIEDLRNGKVVIVADDPDRENEGDFVCAAQLVTPEIINFMTRHTPGYLCVALTAADCDRLELPPQAVANTSLRGTAMAVSVDGHPRHGVGTGISASDRARTARSSRRSAATCRTRSRARSRADRGSRACCDSSCRCR